MINKITWEVAQHWISLEVEWPEEYASVLVWGFESLYAEDPECWKAFWSFENDKKLWFDGGLCCIGDVKRVTHWMPFA